MSATTPNAWQWLRYTYGGRLPDRYRQWVLRDTTDRGWLRRFAVRIVVEAFPWLAFGFVVLVVFTPMPLGLIVGALALALVLSLYFTLTSADELTEARLVKHGFEPGTGKRRRKHSADH